MTKAVEVHGLRKTYRVKMPYQKGFGGWFRPKHQEIVALDDITFLINGGERAAYLGPNGAGKTTTIKLLTGILTPDSGEVRVLGMEPSKQRVKLSNSYGVFFGNRRLLWFHVPVIESFKLFRDMYGLSNDRFRSNLDLLCSMLSISDLLHLPPRKMSTGQSARCELAAAIIHMPKVLFLDDPFVGIDIIVKRVMFDFFTRLNEERGTTILLSTHNLTDVEKFSKRVILLNKGRLIYDGEIAPLKQKVTPLKTITVYLETPSYECRLPDGLEEKGRTENSISFNVDSYKMDIASALTFLQKAIGYVNVSIKEPDLEDVVHMIYEGRSIV